MKDYPTFPRLLKERKKKSTILNLLKKSKITVQNLRKWPHWWIISRSLHELLLHKGPPSSLNSFHLTFSFNGSSLKIICFFQHWKLRLTNLVHPYLQPFEEHAEKIVGLVTTRYHSLFCRNSHWIFIIVSYLSF